MNTAASYTLQADAAKNGETRLNFLLPRCLYALLPFPPPSSRDFPHSSMFFSPARQSLFKQQEHKPFISYYLIFAFAKYQIRRADNSNFLL
jgi:hypothetical protein